MNSREVFCLFLVTCGQNNFQKIGPMLTKKLNSVQNLVTREAFGEVLLHKNVRTLLFSQGTNSDTKKSQ